MTTTKFSLYVGQEIRIKDERGEREVVVISFDPGDDHRLHVENEDANCEWVSVATVIPESCT